MNEDKSKRLDKHRSLLEQSFMGKEIIADWEKDLEEFEKLKRENFGLKTTIDNLKQKEEKFWSGI